MMPRRRPLGGLLLTLALPRLARAQGFPDRPLRFIVPFAPGGSTDVTGRVLAEAVGSTLGQTVVVENRTGAGLVVGTEVAARAEPDGQTVLVTSNSHAIVPSLVAKLPYDPVTDFAGVFIPGALPQTVVINPKLPARTLGEFIALLKAEPGRYA